MSPQLKTKKPTYVYNVYVIIIIGVEVFFTEEDYRVIEDGGSLPVVVAKSARIAFPITLSISPLTLAEALASGGPVPSNVPQDNPLSPSRASELLKDQQYISSVRLWYALIFCR